MGDRWAVAVAFLALACSSPHGDPTPDGLGLDGYASDLGPDLPTDGRSVSDGVGELRGDNFESILDAAVDVIEHLPDSEAVADASPDADNTGAPFALAFVTPTDTEQVTGSIWVELAPVGPAELLLDALTVTANGKEIYSDVKLPARFVLDSRAWDTTVLKLGATATLGNATASTATTIGVTNPTFTFKQIYANTTAVSNGQPVAIVLSTGKAGLDVSADFQALDDGYQPGSETVTEIGAGKVKIHYTISADNGVPDGLYEVPVTITDGTESQLYEHLRFRLENAPALPFRVMGGVFVPETIPAADPSFELPPPLVGGNEFVITGGSAKVTVDFSAYPDPEEIIGVLFSVAQHGGYYQVPLTGSQGVQESLLVLKSYLEGEQPPAQLPLRVALRDVTGRTSPVVERNIAVTEVGSGDVQVSVSWDTATDVDLHVVEPAGYELWYGDKSSPMGGVLDLDSNPACAIDGVNNENVFWPPGMAPIGTYVVRVDFYSDCPNCGFGPCGANYTVTMNYCGENELFEGVFAPGDDDSGGEGSGVEVASFSNESCGQVLRGRIRYEDRTFDGSGFRAATWRPARHVVVELVRKQDGKLLATGTTDRHGNYEIQFGNSGEPGIYIVVHSKTDFQEGLHPIVVMNHPKFETVYTVSSPSLDESKSDHPVIDFDIPEIVGAGAFNILDVLVAGYDGLLLYTGKDLGPLEVFWATGADTTDTLYCSPQLYEQGICSQPGTLSVQGKDSDRDEYDDMVILKEFFKLALEQVSRDDNPGGPVTGARGDPRQAWTDGVATFLSAQALGQQVFVNSRPWGVYLVTQLESESSPFSYKTASGAMDGPVSPLLVAALLHDLADSGTGEPFDAIDDGSGAIYDAVFNYLPSDDFSDRGADGVDLTDFLDGWLCRGWGQLDALLELVVEHRQFPYDAAAPGSCLH